MPVSKSLLRDKNPGIPRAEAARPNFFIRALRGAVRTNRKNHAHCMFRHGLNRKGCHAGLHRMHGSTTGILYGISGGI